MEPFAKIGGGSKFFYRKISQNSQEKQPGRNPFLVKLQVLNFPQRLPQSHH